MDGVEIQKRLCDLRAAYDAAPPGSAKQFACEFYIHMLIGPTTLETLEQQQQQRSPPRQYDLILASDEVMPFNVKKKSVQ